MKITYDTHFHNHPISTSHANKLGCSEEVLEKIESKLDSMIEKHSKVFTLRFDIRYPKSMNIVCGNELISNFVDNFTRSFKRKKCCGGHKIDPKCIYVEERESSENKHYHFFVLMNGNARNNVNTIHSKANQLWNSTVHSDEKGLVDFCKKYENGIRINRNAEDFQVQYNKAFYQASYLAKTRGKEKRDKGTWLVKCSR